MQNIEMVVLAAFGSVLQMRLRQQSIYPMCTLATRKMINSILRGEFKRQILIRIHSAQERLWSMYPPCVKNAFPKLSNENHPLIELEHIRSTILKHHQLKQILEQVYFRRSILLWRTLRKYILLRDKILCDSINDLKIIWTIKVCPWIRNIDNVGVIAHEAPDIKRHDASLPTRVTLDSHHAIDVVQRGGAETCPKSSKYHSCAKHLINELKKNSTSLSSTHYLQLIQSSLPDSKSIDSVDQGADGCNAYENDVRSAFHKWSGIYEMMLQIMDKRIMQVHESMKQLRRILDDRSVTQESISRTVDDLATATDVYYAIRCFCNLERMLD